MRSVNSWISHYGNVVRFVYKGETYVLERADKVLKILNTLPSATVHHVLLVARDRKVPHYRIGKQVWFDVREVFDFARVVPIYSEPPWSSRVPSEKMLTDGQILNIKADLIRLGEEKSVYDGPDDDVVRFEYNEDSYKLVKADKIADLLPGVGESFVHKQAHKRDIAHFRIGERVWFDEREVLDYSYHPSTNSKPRPVKIPGEKIMSIAEKIRTELDIIRFDAKPHSFPGQSLKLSPKKNLKVR